MAQEIMQQIAQRLSESERTLIAFPHNPGSKESGDALGSALALYRYMQKLGKHVDMVSDAFAPGRFAFLPHAGQVRSELATPHTYTVRVNTAHAPLKEWSYGLKEGALELYLTPQEGSFRSDDISVQETTLGYDTIVTLDAPDLHTLGKLFENHAELFYKTPIINIDHHAENEQYGQINCIDINASATGEILANVFSTIGKGTMDKEIATNLFAAIFLKTNGFKHPAITPHTLKLAAELIHLGAQREEIMNQLFRNRSLASLRLWGRALAHLKHNPITQLAWSTLTTREIIESGGDLRELPDVIEELIFTSPEAKLVALIYEEHEGRICVMLGTKKASRQSGAHALPLTAQAGWKILSSSPSMTSYCLLNHTLISAEHEVIEKLNGMLKLLPH